MKKHWYDHMWILSLTYLILGFFNIMFAWLGLSRKKDIPGWMKSRAFRYGFLIFFLTMFCQMLWNTVLVFAGASDLKQIVTLLWQLLEVPRNWAYHGTLFQSRHSPVCLWILQCDADFYHIGAYYHGARSSPAAWRAYTAPWEP